VATPQRSQLRLGILTASDGEDEEVVEDADEDLARKLARELQAQEAEEQLRYVCMFITVGPMKKL